MGAESVGDVVACEVITTDEEAQRYWRALEFGSGQGSRPWPNAGPRTVNREGRVFSRKAPRGFIRLHQARFVKFLRDAYRRALRRQSVVSRAALVQAANEAGREALAQILSAGVPADSGTFRSSLRLREAR